MDDYDFERDAEVDLDNLHVEWSIQSSLMLKYGQAVAKARKKMRNAEENVKVVRSRLIKKKKKQNKSSTMQEIEAYYRLHPSHKKAKSRFADAEYDYNMLMAAVTAMHHKKSGLEGEVRLHGQQYFAGPEVPFEIGKEFFEKVHKRLGKEKMKKRKRTKGMTSKKKKRRTRG